MVPSYARIEGGINLFRAELEVRCPNASSMIRPDSSKPRSIISGETPNFVVPASEPVFPCMPLNDKTAFFVVVDIRDDGALTSKRGRMKRMDFAEKEFVLTVETEQGRPDDQPIVQESPQ
jgi:hypothetical protein